MKRWMMFSLVILVSLVTGTGYYYYNYIYKDPRNVENREIDETNTAYERVMQDAFARAGDETYTCKVLINPSGGVDHKEHVEGAVSESEVVLAVAQAVKRLNEDEALGIFLTRDSDTMPTYEQRESICNAVDPDMIIDLHVSESDDTSVIGVSVYYDDSYYDFHLTNSSLADKIERAVVTQTEGVAAGIYPDRNEEYNFAYGRKVPSVAVSVGYITNEREAEALRSPAYTDNIARGILAGVEDALNQ